jgi:hypothetical protein
MSASRLSSEGSVWIFCPRTGAAAKTAMRGTVEQFDEVERHPRALIHCPICRAEHPWQSVAPHFVADDPVLGHA